MASSVATPLERRFGRIAGLSEMTSVSQPGFDVDHAAVRPGPRRHRGRARRAGGDQRGRRRAARQPAHPAQLPQGQPGRLADHDRRAVVGRRCRWRRCSTPRTASSPRRSRRSKASARCSSAAASSRRCACRSIRRRWRGGPVDLEDLRGALAASTANQPKGSVGGSDVRYTVAANSQLFGADAYNQLVVSYQNGAGVRLGRRGARVRRRREQPPRRLDGRQARRADDHPPAAGREHPARPSTA